MKIKTGWLFFLLLSTTIIGIVSNTGCANIIPPTGGPRDTIPPILVQASPKDSNVNFTGNKIVLTFNEYIDPKDIRTELVVNPVPKIDPIVDAKLRQVTIRIKDTLQPNTTYSLQFNKGIKDVDEDNILRNFTYAFSTGSRLDNGEFTGSVFVANTGKTDSTLVAILHLRFDDSAVVKDRPRYIARVDSTGHFHFRFIQPGSYALYAMKDEGGSHKYLSKSQLFAFADSPVVISSNTPPVSLYAYSEAADVKSTPKPPSTAAKPPTKAADKDKRLQFQTSISGNTFDVLDTFRLLFPNAMKVFDSTKIRFTDDNFQDIDPKTYRFARDSTNKKFFLFYAWPTDTKYHLVLARDFAQDSAGRRLLKIDTINFQTKKDIDYGEVRIRIPNLDLSRRPVLQFVSGDAVKFAYPFNGRREIRKVLFPPGDYELRVLYDANGNGVWDTGIFFGKHRQPEKVTPIRKKYTVKANWDNDLDITL
jgi:uncharacterized protein (DUF2141 family)